MRFLGVGDSCDLGAMYLELLRRGHEVRAVREDPDGQDTFAGLVPDAGALGPALDWARDGIVICETAHHGELQDELRRRGVRVVGGSALGDRLEGDRDFGQRALAAAGLAVAPTHPFDDFDRAIDFVSRSPGRYVLKFNGAGLSSARTYVGARPDGRDLVALLEWHRGRWDQGRPSFVLMAHREGVEVGVGAFFDGSRFLEPACLDWEHKRFFPGDLGEMTGEMGTLATWQSSGPLFRATLGRLAGTFAGSGHVGWVNLNTIVNEEGVWPLELTCRFGYPGYAVLRPLQDVHWDELLGHLVERRGPGFPTRPGYAVGVVLTVPPFPSRHGYAELGKGLPILLDGTSSDDWEDLHWGEVAQVDGRLVTSGQVGYVGVVTGTGDSAETAARKAYERVRQVVIPSVRYRDDIGARFVREDRKAMVDLGWLPRS